MASDFTGTGAPDSSTDLSYTCAGSAAGTGCSGSIAASESAGTDVRTFGADAHSADAGDSASVNWTLLNKPTHKTGSYTATVTLTISAT